MEIEAADVRIGFDGHEVLRGERLVCRPGTITGLVGPSGCGKTTLLHCLGLLLRPDSGRVLVEGQDTSGWGSGRIRRFWRDHAAFVLQEYGIVEDESVAYNVTMTASLLTNRVVGDRARLEEALDRTGLAGRADERAAHLSGGEKRRLAIARAIYKDAAVIFVDEPTASLDAEARRRVVELLVERARAGCTVVAATHDDEMMAACGVLHQVGAERAPSQEVTER